MNKLVLLDITLMHKNFKKNYTCIMYNIIDIIINKSLQQTTFQNYLTLLTPFGLAILISFPQPKMGKWDETKVDPASDDVLSCVRSFFFNFTDKKN